MIIFFIRAYNDIDHIIPIVYKMVKEDAGNVLVLCMNPFYNIHTDRRLVFLRDNYNVLVDYVYNRHKPSLIYTIVSRLTSTPLFQNSLQKAIWSFYDKFLRNFFYEKIAKRFFLNRQWVMELLKKDKAVLLIFDYAKPSQFITGELLKAAKELRITTMAVPHGIRQWKNEEWMASPETEAIRSKGFDEALPYDFIAMPNEEHKNFMISGGIAKEKVIVLGSARFCKEWTEVMSTMNSYHGTMPETYKLKVVFMEGGYRFLTDEDTVSDTLNKLSELDELELIVKLKTRSPALKLERLNSTVKVANDVPSPILIEWADAVIIGNTSILYEVFLQGKTLIYPGFFYSLKMILEEMNVGWIVNSYEELESALYKLKEDRAYKPYSQDDVDRFLTEIVYGGVKGRDVLGDYRDFILKMAGLGL